ncbi:MAG: Xaa-Pro peptidase family protein [Oscillospiraceae bacterium]|nr:Xaa-Pro peptidase family protein [Oscillospiraceae bacterium]
MTALETLMRNFPAGGDAAIVTGVFNRRYLTGMQSSAGALLFTRDKARFIIDSRYIELARRTVPCEAVLQGKLYGQIADFLKEAGARTLLVENDVCTLEELSAYKEKLSGVEISESGALSEQIWKQRRVKTAAELNAMRRAQEVTDKVFEAIIGKIAAGRTEREIALEMEFMGRKMGMEGVSFSFIVAGGANSSMPHAVPGEYAIKKGDLITMDFGFVAEGYCSDMTRTVAVGYPSEKQKEVYRTVIGAQDAAFAKIAPGVPCREVDAAARSLIDGGSYRGLFGHGLGHGLGLEVHESPRFNEVSEATLEIGMAMSVEPGIYIPKEFGVRVEDVVFVTQEGFENITRSPKELLIL